MIQFVITPSAGKRIIAKAVAEHPAVKTALSDGTIVIVAGTTNGYVSEEILNLVDQAKDFDKKRFFRGITLPANFKTTKPDKLPSDPQFPGDVVITKGLWQKGKTIFDVIDNLKEGDVIIKGANCVNLVQKKAGVLIGHPKGGTTTAALQAVVGKRVKLILPVGLEKRISADIDVVAAILNAPGSSGPRLLPVPGEIVTEIESIKLLSDAKATLVAGGGVCGAEGAVRIVIEGEQHQIDKIKIIIDNILCEPLFSMW